ncbi:hypothetical protein BHJ80_21405 [Escherichia coli]|nr:hypothetical protein BHJ80_21405 [Escherichia coli]
MRCFTALRRTISEYMARRIWIAIPDAFLFAGAAPSVPAGAAITITVLTLAAVNTLGIPVDLPTALLVQAW